ncbi:MAG: aspartate racemase-like protein [Polaromonas sp.]|jgi:aspartate racemase|nr:aspartate racemase-like protein [Polaromonas sp.]
MIGILGGMGPLATADFFSKVIAASPATCDEEHVPLLIQSDPRIPARPPAILGCGPSPLPALLEGRNRLIAAGAVALAMPCNTAHVWYPDLLQDCTVPFLSIVEACCAEVMQITAPGDRVGIIATRATLATGLFDARLRLAGLQPLMPADVDLDELILPAIEQVKRGQAARAGPPLEAAVRRLQARGAGAVLLACTETPVALDAIESPLRARCIDSNAALARACVQWWKVHQRTAEAAFSN